MKRLFFSFSAAGDSEARDFCRRLLARLVDHGIDAWIYESPGGRIASGDSIAETCRARIEESEMFVLLVNDAALRSDFVGMEVAHALWVQQQRSLSVFPIIATDRAWGHWPPQFRELVGYRGLNRAASLNPVEDAMLDICGRLSVTYVRDVEYARLPLARRLTEEIKSLRSATEYDAHEFQILINKSTKACEFMGRREYDKARKILTGIIAELDVLYGMPVPYYPTIVLGASLLGLASSGAVGYDVVLAHFDSLMADAPDRVDANAHAGRANALMGLGRHAEAMASYRSAEQALQAPDATLFYNMARAQLLAGQLINVDDLQRRRTAIADGLLTSNPGDLSRIAAVLVLCHAHCGDTEAAWDIWRSLVVPADVFVELSLEIADVLQDQARQGDYHALRFAAELLDSMQGRPDTTPFEQAQLTQIGARIAFDLGHVDAARAAVGELLVRFPGNPLYAVDAAMYALGDDDAGAARTFCSAVTALSDYRAVSPPLAATEFEYLVGQAFWLLGDESASRHSFRRSGQPEALWYARSLVLSCGVAKERSGMLTRWRQMF